jgi:hypothetical protein
MRRHLASVGGRHAAEREFDPPDFFTAMVNSVLGACGENVVAKALNIYWDGSVNTFRSRPDVGKYEVRTRSNKTKNGKPYQLLVRPDDDDAKDYYLVRLIDALGWPRFRIIGHIRGGDAKRPEWFHPHGGYKKAYFVPDEALIPFEEN